jgi:hypothetical protein
MYFQHTVILLFALTVSAISHVAIAQTPSQTELAKIRAQTDQWCKVAAPALQKTMRQAPEKLAQQTAKTGDLRYLEWHGLYSTAPGIKSPDCAKAGHLTKVFQGTSDAVCSQEHADLNKKSYAYAEMYNTVIAAERSKRHLKTCN